MGDLSSALPARVPNQKDPASSHHTRLLDVGSVVVAIAAAVVVGIGSAGVRVLWSLQHGRKAVAWQLKLRDETYDDG